MRKEKHDKGKRYVGKLEIAYHNCRKKIKAKTKPVKANDTETSELEDDDIAKHFTGTIKSIVCKIA